MGACQDPRSKGALGGVSLFLIRSPAPCEVGPACRTPAEGLREPDRGMNLRDQGQADSESLKPGGDRQPASRPWTSHFSLAAALGRGTEGRPESQATANGLCGAQVR